VDEKHGRRPVKNNQVLAAPSNIGAAVTHAGGFDPELGVEQVLVVLLAREIEIATSLGG